MSGSVVDRLAGTLRALTFGISPNETSFARRGFHAATPEARAHLEGIGGAFVEGYHAALRAGRPEGVVAELGAIDPALAGFAFEGAAMAFALLDALLPWRRGRLDRFLAHEGARHVYMGHVGAGWAFARLRRSPAAALGRLDPLLGWLAVDGYGFHEGYFHPESTVERRVVPARVEGRARPAFDQGLGRSLWFVRGADVAYIAATVAGFPAERRADLWSGVGLACAYAGGVPRSAVERLCELAGEFGPHLAQGAAFAAKARERAGNLGEHTEMACDVLCGRPAGRAAALTDEALVGLPAGGAEPAYEVWRRRVRDALSKKEERPS